MIEIKPMDEGYLHLNCLHGGPIDTTKLEPLQKEVSSDLPPGPWSDEMISELVAKIGHAGPRQFIREMIRRYGTCAILAWEKQKVVGHLRFYPMKIARMVYYSDFICSEACEPKEDEGTIWVLCVMTSTPYDDSEGAKKAGARKGIGQKLIQGLITWARKHGWQRLVKVAHADLDCFYGNLGGGGKSFWEKAGFKVASTFYKCPEWSDDFMALVLSQAKEEGMIEREAWTWYRMRYEL